MLINIEKLLFCLFLIKYVLRLDGEISILERKQQWEAAGHARAVLFHLSKLQPAKISQAE